uniref:Uncharacterized protein n=1 Tax=Kalanchoe fedtschenkoi TaxID=63787 RepID=A0A7N0UBE5_KALFE
MTGGDQHHELRIMLLMNLNLPWDLFNFHHMEDSQCLLRVPQTSTCTVRIEQADVTQDNFFRCNQADFGM